MSNQLGYHKLDTPILLFVWKRLLFGHAHHIFDLWQFDRDFYIVERDHIFDDIDLLTTPLRDIV